MRAAVYIGAAAALASCTGPLSTLDPAGPAAASIATLWWVMLAGAAVLFALVMVLFAIDAVPGHVNVLRIQADVPGRYQGLCNEFCGTGHSGMRFDVEVHPATDFSTEIERPGTAGKVKQ